jgi:hypothetical protein
MVKDLMMKSSILILLSIFVILTLSGCEMLLVFNENRQAGSSQSSQSSSSQSSLSSSSFSSSSSSSSSSISSISYLNYVVYVSVSGNDSNNGTNQPVRTIQQGIERAYHYSREIIYIEQGTYREAVNIKYNNLGLFGGWSSDFSTQSGYSTIDGSTFSDSLIYATNLSSIWIAGFILQHSTNSVKRGCGIQFYSVDYSVVSNTIIRWNENNGAAGTGAVMSIYESGNNSFYVTVMSNHASNGAVIEFWLSSYNTIGGEIAYNTAADYSGIYMDYCSDSAIQAYVHSNIAGSAGVGGVLITPVSSYNMQVTNNVISNYPSNTVWRD